MDRKYAVIADDLTGAMDAGTQLVKENVNVKVCINSGYINKIYKDTDVVVFDTETRNVDERIAYNKIKKCISLLNRNDILIIYKKIDSTLRGNIGIELDVTLEETEKDLIFFAPALPFFKRFTRNGYHYVNGKKLEETEVASDPLFPVYTSFIPEIISQQSLEGSYLVDIRTLKKSISILLQKIKELYSQGYRIIIFDAETNKELEKIVILMSELNFNILPCGSAGLFKYVVSSFETIYKRKIKKYFLINKNSFQPRQIIIKDEGPIIVISGSLSKISKQQIEYALGHLDNIGYIKITGDYLFKSQKDRKKEIEMASNKGIDIYRSGMDIILGVGKKINYLNKVQGRVNNQFFKIKSETILDGLYLILRRIFKKNVIKGLVLIGGNTAFEICTKLSAYGIYINDEVEPYIPLGVLLSNKFPNIPIITKSGSFGNKNSLVSIIEYMRELT